MDNPTIIGIAWILVVVVIFYRMQKSGGLKALIEHSKNSPQYWGEFALLMAGVFLFIYLLIII